MRLEFWDSRGHEHCDEKEEPAQIPRRTGSIPSACRFDEIREREGEEARANDPRETGQTADCPLKFALFGFAYPVFTTSHNEEVAKLGSFKLQTQKETHHMIPPIVSGGFLGLGAFVIAAGVPTRR